MMQFLVAIQLTSVLLSLQLSSTLSCDIANWWTILDNSGWAVCPRTNTYIKGFWRNNREIWPFGQNGIYLLEEAKCCEASQGYSNNGPASCRNADWSSTLDSSNVWARCPTGFYLNGIRTSGKSNLHQIEEAKCCRPQNHPNAYDDCYEEDVTISFDNKGWSECKRDGYYMTGFYRSGCDLIYCIERFSCCKMRNVCN